MRLPHKTQFVAIPYELINSDIWWKLDRAERDLYIVLRSQIFNGRENHTQDFIITGPAKCSRAIHRTHFPRAIWHLVNAGLIDVIQEGGRGNQKWHLRFCDTWKIVSLTDRATKNSI